MTVRRALTGGLAAALVAVCAAAAQPASPPWVADAVGDYAGLVRNAGRMQCHHTRLELRGGQLVGHYWIDSADPFEGELTGFRPDADGAGGSFTWTDRYGTGVEALRFSAGFAGFRGAWGRAEPDPGLPIAARRGTGCAPAPAIS